MHELKTFVFFGIVGSGKGTQISLLKKYLEDNFQVESIYIYPGNEYRRHIEDETYLGKLIKESMAEGNLQPDLITTSIVTNILINYFDGKKAVFFDGYPRTIEQSKNMLTLLDFFKLQNIELIYIELSKEEAMKRNLARGRFDDTKEGIEKRFNEYVNNVLPAMEFLEKNRNYKVHKIDGAATIEQVHQSIIKSLNI